MSDRDQLLERLLSGEASPADPAVRALFERDPTAREDYEALRELEGSLERQGDRAREVVEASQRMPTRVGAEQVLATLTRIAQDAPAREVPTRRRIRPVWLALAAGLIAALAWAWWSRSKDPAREPEILLDPGGSAELVLQSPIGPVAQYAPFEWVSELAPGGWFEVEISDPDRPESEPMRSPTLYESRWDPPVPAGGWSARIVWTVKRIDASGIPDGVQESAEASLH
jgi:hypothetical protein